MIRFLDTVTFLLACAYGFVFFVILKTFLPLRKTKGLKILAFFVLLPLADVTIYSNDLANLLGVLLGFAVYIALLHRGRPLQKLTALLVFYPSFIAVNYLMQDIGCRLFFWSTGAPDLDSGGWTDRMWLLSTTFHTCSLFLRLLFWIAVWIFMKKYLTRISQSLTKRMWIIVDTLMLAPFVAIFTIIYFLPENAVIVYPICAASIFSSFGALYLAAYISDSLQTAYRARTLENKLSYYQEKVDDEKRIRSIYHDMKNHLLVLEAQSARPEEVETSIQTLKDQIEVYETYYHTGNEFLDIIIRDKAQAAKEKKIDFSAVIHFEDGSFLEPLDISAIFGNALDNAIEASEKLPEDLRLITAKASRIHDMLVITVENNTPPDAFSIKNTSKEDTFLHGFGLPNIKNAVAKYDGECIPRQRDGRFALKIMIPVP